jgi:hypothetical protein
MVKADAAKLKNKTEAAPQGMLKFRKNLKSGHYRNLDWIRRRKIIENFNSGKKRLLIANAFLIL